MCDEARGCHSGTPDWVIFAEYVRFNRAIVTIPQQYVVKVFRVSRSLSAQKCARMNSGFCRERDETHGTVFGNRPHKSKRNSEKSLQLLYKAYGMGEILEGGKSKWQ